MGYVTGVCVRIYAYGCEGESKGLRREWPKYSGWPFCAQFLFAPSLFCLKLKVTLTSLAYACSGIEGKRR